MHAKQIHLISKHMCILHLLTQVQLMAVCDESGAVSVWTSSSLVQLFHVEDE